METVRNPSGARRVARLQAPQTAAPGTTAAAGPSDVYVFGATVLAAQVWGLSVETLYQAVERRHNSANRDLYDEPPAARAPTALIDALRASFHDLELLDELAELAELQDLIANRYLRVRHNTGAVSPLFDHQARAELSTIALRFIKSERRVRDAYGDVTALDTIEPLVAAVEVTFRPVARQGAGSWSHPMVSGRCSAATG